MGEHKLEPVWEKVEVALSHEGVILSINGEEKLRSSRTAKMPSFEISELNQAARFREELIMVRTTWNTVGQIEHEVNAPTGQMQRRVLNTMERHVRDALVQMGWTPPGGER